MIYLVPPEPSTLSQDVPAWSAEDANFNFALEKYAMEELDIGSSYFLFWRTTPTLMIGRYQNTLAEINMAYAREHNVNIVRRVTGGGTIYTDPNGWQFSFIIRDPGEHRIEFSHFTKPILDALHSLGVDAQFSGRNDLTIEGKKFSGNAQYIRRDVVLHHGSLLFDTDLDALVRALNVADEKIIAKGIQSVRQRVTNIADYLPEKMTSLAFRDVMLSHLLRDMETYTLTERDIRRIIEIREAVFDQWSWNFGNDPQFNVMREGRFSGGKLTAHVFVEGGCIKDIHFYGDFFAKEGLEQLTSSLVGCRYEPTTIREALSRLQAQDYFYQISLDELFSCII
ncbi:MAG: lipoate--protein ligase [Firmicutes bacterium HGW-Firmicutes-9]|jgi:lipoate-protein ligase A|nr:MAG: lipoate--protein ligase [Firmicutes bacterium HGW-Firmicutes-9]